MKSFFITTAFGSIGIQVGGVWVGVAFIHFMSNGIVYEGTNCYVFGFFLFGSNLGGL